MNTSHSTIACVAVSLGAGCGLARVPVALPEHGIAQPVLSCSASAMSDPFFCTSPSAVHVLFL